MDGCTDEVDYGRLISDDGVHASLYYNQQVFDDEIANIWRKIWLYVGHESEVREPGDYRTRKLATTPVILTRDDDRKIHVLVNRCPHRGNAVCVASSGQASVLRCAYHGWTFASSGKSLGVPYGDAYSSEHGKDDMSMSRLPKVESYRGLIFASFNEEVPPLEEHLAGAKDAINQWLNRSPSGDVQVCGTQRMQLRANWKIPLENAIDDYHPVFVHRAVFELDPLYKKQALQTKGKQAVGVSRDLGQGHAQLDFGTAKRVVGGSLTEPVPDDVQAEYEQSIRDRLGDTEAERVLQESTPHDMIFPNLFVLPNDLRVIEPVGVRETSYHSHVVKWVGADPAINRVRLRQHEMSDGPAGAVLQDDLDVFQRLQWGLETSTGAIDEWLDLSRGMHRERTDERGFRVSMTSDEIGQRAVWNRYRELMVKN